MELHNRFSTLCLTCLSVDRKMIRLKELFNVYQKCIGEDKVCLMNDKSAICWECHAYLRKIEMFRKRVQRAQELLNNCKNTVSLSQLNICQNPNIDLTEMKNINIKVEIKEVIEEHEIEFNIENDLNVDSLVEDKLKKEHEVDITEHSSGVENENYNDNFVSNKGKSICKPNHTNVKEQKSKGKNKGLQRRKSNLKIKQLKSPLKLKPESSTNDVDNEEDTAHSKTVLYLDEICNGVFETNYDSKTLNMALNRESKNRAKNTVNKDNSEKYYTRDNKRLKYRHMDIDTLYERALKEEPDDMKNKELYIKEKDCNDIKLYECKACSTVVKSIDREFHMKGHYTLMQCLTCYLIFDGRQQFYKHYKDWHSKYICDHCGVKFKVKSLIEKHMRGQHFTVNCKVCGREFRNHKKWMIHHRHQHQQSAPAYCVECDLDFASEYRYKRHLVDSVRHKPRPKVSVPCPDCDKVFSKSTYMKVHHEFVHLKQFNNRCDVCNKSFLRRSGLTRHKLHVHDGVERVKNKICYICGRGFSTNRILSNHIVTHTGERPHECVLCNARFTQHTALVTHRRARHPEAGPLPLPPKPKHLAFGCDLCSANFATADRLEDHKKDIHLVTHIPSFI